MTSFSKSEAISFGWNRMKSNFWLLAGICLLIILINIPFSLANTYFQNRPGETSLQLINVVLQIINIFLQIWLSLGAIKIFLYITDRGKATIADLFSCGDLIFKTIAAGIISAIMFMIGIILLIVPGIIVAIRLQFVTYIIVDQGLGPIEAIERSWRITKGHAWNLFLFSLLVFLLNIAGVIVLLVGALATYPTSMIATAHIYRWLNQNYSQPPTVS